MVRRRRLRDIRMTARASANGIAATNDTTAISIAIRRPFQRKPLPR